MDEAASHLVAVIREVRPLVLATYNDNGGYGHPDHIQTHRVAMRSAELAADATYRADLGEALATSPRSMRTPCRAASWSRAITP